MRQAEPESYRTDRRTRRAGGSSPVDLLTGRTLNVAGACVQPDWNDCLHPEAGCRGYADFAVPRDTMPLQRRSFMPEAENKADAAFRGAVPAADACGSHLAVKRAGPIDGIHRSPSGNRQSGVECVGLTGKDGYPSAPE